MKIICSHISFLIGLMLSMPGISLAQQDATGSLEDGKMVFTLSRKWSPEEVQAVRMQFGLDSALVANALASSTQHETVIDSVRWHVGYPSRHEIRIWKAFDATAQVDQNSDFLISEFERLEGPFSGPGYVNPADVSYGINKLKADVIVQYSNGKTKFLLPIFDDAHEVIISGSFNNWSTGAMPMTKTQDGWEITLLLQPGKYLYKYIVDGKWISDPFNELRENDGVGGNNSVFYRYNHRFELAGYPKAKKVFLVGSFNNWHKKKTPMERVGDSWILPLYLREGTHAYKFLVDKKWITDPTNPTRRPDGFGDYNSFVSLGDTTIFRLKGYPDANQIILTGVFNAWNESELTMDKTAAGWELSYALPAGTYEYKYIVDGTWMTDPENPYYAGSGDFKNSLRTVKPNHVFTLDSFPDAEEVIVTGSFSGWDEQKYRMARQDGQWIFPVHLHLGKHQYKFRVDGEWILDPDNPLYEDNEFGTGNSIIWIEPEAMTLLNGN